MAKEFKPTGSKDFKGKKPFSSKKRGESGSDKKSSFGSSREDSHPFSAFKRDSDKDFKKNTEESSEVKESKYEKKTPYNRSGDDASKGKGFKRDSSKGFKSDKPFESKKSRTDKRDNKPSFDRFRDESRPSDFGGLKKQKAHPSPPEGRESQSTFQTKDSKRSGRSPLGRSGGASKPPFSDKPAFKKRREEGDEKPSFRDRGDEKPKSFGKTAYPGKPAFTRKSDGVNPNDLDESDFEYGNDKPKFTSDSGRGFKKTKPFEKRPYSKNKSSSKSKPQRETDDGLIRLNRYLSNAGICSRREADVLIASGVVQVNGKNITEMGYRVKPTDIVKYGGQTLKKERLVYLILNKPKDYITTADDPQERRTVLELLQGACKERIYPVGRLDRATTGLLMFTNDGDLTKKLTHPRYGVRKIYHVELDKPIKRADLDTIAEGLELEDGPIKVDEVTYIGDGADKTQVGVEIHSGKNRIVRRIFEHMGYNVRKLDRVMFGSLTKKDLPRGRWRILSDAEVGMLKMISAE